MFTGIVTDIGIVKNICDHSVIIQTKYKELEIGSSIACNGCCLTVVARKDDTFTAEFSDETIACTNISNWQCGTVINLEKSLRLGDEMGGHWVTGHIDGLGKIISHVRKKDCDVISIQVDQKLMKFIAAKGSVAVDGVSLTVNGVEANFFWVTIIPYTNEFTVFSKVAVGYMANIEVDIIARYVERLFNYTGNGTFSRQ